MAKISTKAELLSSRPLQKAVANLGDGGEVEVQELSAAQRDQISKLLVSEDRNIFEINARIAVFGIPFLSEEDIPELMDGSIENFMPLVEKIIELSGMGEESLEEEKND